jgi:hypothetical protein
VILEDQGPVQDNKDISHIVVSGRLSLAHSGQCCAAMTQRRVGGSYMTMFKWRMISQDKPDMSNLLNERCHYEGDCTAYASKLIRDSGTDCIDLTVGSKASEVGLWQ